MTMEIKCIKNGFKMKDAFETLSKRSKKFSIEKMDLLFYPYLMMEFSIKYRGKLERLSENIICMCDMWKGLYSMAKSAGEFQMVKVEEGTVIPSKLDEFEVIKKAPREIYGEIQKKKRVLNIPDIEYENSEVVYKPFFIVECLNEEKESFHILFDAVTGEFSLLNA